MGEVENTTSIYGETALSCPRHFSFGQIIKKVCILLCAFYSGSVYSYYYVREDFSSALGSHWVSYFVYGRDGVIVPSAAGGTPSTLTVTGGVLRMRGTPNDGDGYRNGFWVGRNLYLTNRFAASAVRPFGVEMIRSYAFLDFATNSTTATDSRRRCSTGIWLFVDTVPEMPKTLDYSRVNEWLFLQNHLEFANEVGVWGTEARRKIMYYDSAEVDFNPSNAVRPDGTVYNAWDRINFDFRIDLATGVAQTDEVGFRFTHNGSTVYFQVNPDPYDNDAAPNEWMTLGSKPMTWNTNIQFMVGHAQKAANDSSAPTSRNFQQDADWDNFLIRSAASSSHIFITNTFIAKSVYQKAVLFISNSFSVTDAGINFIRIEKPASFRWHTNIYDNIEVRVLNSTGERILNFTTVPYSQNVFPRQSEAAVLTTPHPYQSEENAADEIRILLGTQFTAAFASARTIIEVTMLLKPIADTFYTDEFHAYVTAEQFDSMDSSQKNRYATCGWQHACGSARIVRRENIDLLAENGTIPGSTR